MDYDIDLSKNDVKWDILQARVSPDEKSEIYTHCRRVFKLPYSVMTRLIWRKMLSDYKCMPKTGPQDVMMDIERAVDNTVTYLPVIVRQRKHDPRNY